MRRALATLLLLWCTVMRAQVLVDIATDATDPNNYDDAEPSIAVNPLNPLEIAVIAFSGGWDATTNAPIWKSNDGGATWRRVAQFPQPSNGSEGSNDQRIAYTADGKLIAVQLAQGLSVPFDFIYRQTGAADAPLAKGIVFGDDQPQIAVDTRVASPFFGRTYVAWLAFAGTTQRSTASRSGDLGQSVTSVAAGNNNPFQNRTTRIAAGRDGSVYIVYKTREGETSNNFELAHFRVNRSDDGGATWTGAGGPAGVSVHGPTAVTTWLTRVENGGGFGNPAKGKVARARSSDTWIATNPANGDVWVAYCNRDASGFGQIYAVRSTTRGATWSAPVRVTDGTHHSAYPEIAVAGNGAVGVLYVDFDDSGARTIFRHRFARSFDSGTPWNDTILQSMDPAGIENAANEWLWGDYEGLTAAGQTFYGVFTGESIGRAVRQLDPIFFRMTAAPESADVYVRDWTDSPTSADNGASPSARTAFYVTSDVWNRRLDGAHTLVNDQPAHQTPRNGSGAAGDNFLFTRVSRNGLTPAENVTARFLYSEFGTGSNFIEAGSPSTESIAFPAGANGVTMTAGHPWHLPATTSNHLCLAVEISTPSDPVALPSLLNRAPGAPDSDLNVRLDNNKAQRNTAVYYEGATAVTYPVIVHNAAITTRDVVLSYDSGTIPVILTATGGTESVRGTRGTLRLRGLLPGENRWLGIAFDGQPRNRVVSVFVTQLESDTPVSGFAITVTPMPARDVLGATIAARATLARRLGAVYASSAATNHSSAIAAFPAPERTETELADAVRDSHTLLSPLLTRLRTDVAGDPLNLAAAITRLASAIAARDSAAIANADASFVQIADATLTFRQKRLGDAADILQMTRWQNASLQPFSAVCAQQLLTRGTAFVNDNANRTPDARAYETMVRDLSACIPNIAPRIVRTTVPASVSADSLQAVHRTMLIRLAAR
jgi:hypothetical protein